MNKALKKFYDVCAAKRKEQEKIKEWANSEEAKDLFEKVSKLHDKKRDIDLPF